jgi:hypothetical protein
MSLKLTDVSLEWCSIRSKRVKNFFADFARNSSADFKRAQVKQGIVHQRLGATLDKISQQAGDVGQRISAERTYSDIYLTYSNLKPISPPIRIC